MSDVDHLIGTPMTHDRFPTVDEVHAFARDLGRAHPDRVRVRVLGTSTAGEEIEEITIGDGPKHAIIVGNVHPNEPIGLLTIMHLATRLAEHPELVDELATTWHFVPCIDPDGTRLNEGWYSGPITRVNVGRQFYRTPKDRQAEWTFPVEWRGRTIGKPVPETRLLMSLIDETEPALFASLHNADFGGGGYYYVSDGDPEYWEALRGLLLDAGVPVEAGAPDVPGARVFAPGVFEQSPVADVFELTLAADPDAIDTLEGGSPRDYAEHYGTASLVCELPLWVDPRALDQSPSTWRIGDLFRATAQKYREDAEVMTAVLDRLDGKLPETDPRYLALRAALPGNARILDARAQGAASEDRPATHAEAFMELFGLIEMMRLRNGGMLTQLLDVTTDDESGLVARERDAFRTIFDGWCSVIEAERPGEPVPIDRLIWVQTGAILLAATRIRDALPV